MPFRKSTTKKRTPPVPGGRRAIQYGSKTIEFDLILSRRKSLAIQVKPDTSVIVRAPLRSNVDTVDQIVVSRGEWIIKQQKKFAALGVRSKVPQQYIDGEKYPYLGQQIQLKVVPCADEQVTLEDDALVVFVRDAADSQRIERLIGRWYRQQAAVLFEERLNAWVPIIKQRGIPSPKALTLRDMKSRWGSCSSKGRVTLNVRLMHVSIDLIDYVIVHELCHLKELNHGKGFYALLNSFMPDWKARRDLLYRVELS